jgi:recombination protein RecT
MTPERMIRIALTAVSQSYLLQKCDPLTLCGAVVQASILGLEPNSSLGEAFLIPYWNSKANKGKGGYECQLQVGYKGHLKLARNSGELAGVDAQPVYEQDEFDFEKGIEPYVHHKWNKRGTRGQVIGYWAGFKIKGQNYHFEYWSVEQIDEHRDHYSQGAFKKEAGKFVLDSQGKKILQGPWRDSPDWMYRKTVLIQALKLAPKSVLLQTALSLDEQHDAGVPQVLSVDVPFELLPTQNDGLPEGGGEEERVERASDQRQQNAQAATEILPEGFPDPFNAGAFQTAAAKLYTRMVESPMGRQTAQTEWTRLLENNAGLKDIKKLTAFDAALKFFRAALAVVKTAEAMREPGQD